MSLNDRPTNAAVRGQRCRAMTLVEVLAAVVILGTLLVSALLARWRYLHQATLAADKRRAVDAADAMLASWSTGPAMPAADMDGPVPGQPSLAWRTRVLEPADVGQLGARVLRLEIWPADEQHRVTASVSTPWRSSSPEPLVSVELLIPRESSGVASPLARDGGGPS